MYLQFVTFERPSVRPYGGTFSVGTRYEDVDKNFPQKLHLRPDEEIFIICHDDINDS